MTNASDTLRALIVYAIVVPVALLVGYYAGGFNGSMGDVGHLGPAIVLLFVVSVPLIMKWHHPLLFLTWNTSAVVYLLPGHPEVWIVMAALSLAMSGFQRAILRDMRFIWVPSVTLPLLFFALVLVITAKLTGSFGLRVLGSGTFGAKRYVTMLAGMAGFFAMTAHRIPPHKAGLYVGLFFLGGMADTISTLIPYAPRQLHWLAMIFPVSTSDIGPLAATVDLRRGFGEEVTRFYGLTIASMGVFCYLLARYGIREMLAGTKFWRFFLLVAVVILGAFGGFRGALLSTALIFVLTFYFEGLVRSKYFVGLLACGLVASGLVVGFANKLPLSIQRTISFLPIEKIDPVARLSAEGSSEWRVQMWRTVLPEIPKYFWLGKGLGLQELDIQRSADLAERDNRFAFEASLVAGDYHNGPLTVIITFGIFGALTFVWFLIAAIRALYSNFRYGDPALQNINRLLLALFLAKVLMFFFVYGGVYSDLAHFAGLAGLSVALNGGIRRPARVPKFAQPPIPLKVRPQMRPAHAGAQG